MNLQQLETYIKKFAVYYKDVPADENRAFGKYLAKLSTLYGNLDNLYGKEKPKVLDSKDLDRLRQDYIAVFEAAGEFDRYMAEQPSAKKKSKERLGVMHELNKLMQKDFRMLSYAHRAVGSTLPEVMDNARQFTIDIGSQATSVSAGNVSSREAISYTDPSGKEIRGFFTENSHFDREELLQKKRDEIFAAHPEFRDAILACEKSEDYVSQLMSPLLTGRFLDRALYGGADYKTMFKNDIENALDSDPKYANNPELKQQYIDSLMQDTTFSTVFLDFANFYSGIYNTEGSQFSEDGANIKNPDNIADRNVGMTVMADLLGMPEIIARSSKVEVIQDGKVRKGVFMEFADGYDHRDFSDSNPMNDMDENSFDEVSFKKDIADLQILDFVGGNIDRHTANMFYKFEERNGKKALVGVQGIDNDLSGGALKPKSDDRFSSLPVLDDMMVINEDTANRLMALTPDMLKMSLKNLSYTEEELDAACFRLNIIKERIKEGIAYYSNPANKEKGVERGHLRVMTDEEWESLKIATIKEKTGTRNYFKDVMKVPQQHKGAAEGEKLKAEDMEKLYRQYPELRPGNEKRPIAKGTLAGEYDSAVQEKNRGELAAFSEELEVVNSGFFISSQKFNAVKKALDKITKLAALPADKQTDKVREDIKKAYKNLVSAADAYLDKKEKESKEDELNDRSIRRVNFVERLKSFADERLDGIDTYEKSLADAKKSPKAVEPTPAEKVEEKPASSAQGPNSPDWESVYGEVGDQLRTLWNHANQIKNLSLTSDNDVDRAAGAMVFIGVDRLIRNEIARLKDSAMSEMERSRNLEVLLDNPDSMEILKAQYDDLKENRAFRNYIENLPQDRKELLINDQLNTRPAKEKFSIIAEFNASIEAGTENSGAVREAGNSSVKQEKAVGNPEISGIKP